MSGEFASFDWWKSTIDPKIFETEAAIDNIKAAAQAADNAERRKHLLDAIGPVVELTSDYLGMSSYYYNPMANKIYEIENTKVRLSPISNSVDTHLRELNNLPR